MSEIKGQIRMIVDTEGEMYLNISDIYHMLDVLQEEHPIEAHDALEEFKGYLEGIKLAEHNAKRRAH